jgi:hypothetical protein
MYIKLDVYNLILYMNSEILNSKELHIYTYIVGKYIIYLYELYNQVEKQSLLSFFSVLFRSVCK